MKNIVILYHNYCPDGFGAAWAAWKRFGSRADYIGVNYAEPLPKGLKGKEVYTLDFCYDDDNFNKLLKIAKKLVVLDHHISRKEAIMCAHDFRFELEHSGSVIAWKYFHPGKRIPRAILHIEDQDLWRFRWPGTREMGAILSTYPFEFKARDEFIKNFEKASLRKQYIADGAAILRYQAAVIKKTIAVASLVELAGHTVYAVNSFILTSEIGGELANKKGPFGIVWSERQGRVVVSLRSRSGFDVSRIAMKYGGGGHKAAAGFSFLVNEQFPWSRPKRRRKPL
ncbi:MAG: DHHA1 domain-containing protein [Patescibacteria group bacterium]